MSATTATHKASDNKIFNDLCAQAAQQSVAIEEARCLPKELARALADYGMFSMFVPKKIGGGEWDAPVGMAHLQKLGGFDAASAWVCMIGATTGLGAAYIAPDIATQIFGGGRITGGIFAPSGQALCDGDDYVINGRWAWASGSANADYIGVGCMVVDNAGDAPDPTRTRFIMVPREAIIFHDTWHTMGLRGTSSGDIELRDKRVPMAYSYALSDGAWDDSPLYRMPYFGFLAAGVAAIALGNARAAIDDFKTLAMRKKPSGATRPLHAIERIQNGLAHAEADWGAAHAFYWDGVNDVWARQSASTTRPDVETKMQLRLVSSHAVRVSANVVRAIHDMAGGTSVYNQSAIQRRLRDAQTMTQHIITGPGTYDVMGRIMLGGYQPSMMI